MNRPIAPDSRLRQLTQWLDVVMPGHSPPVAASSDASFRRYFRVFCDDQPWIVMDAPPGQEDCRPFIDVSERLALAGVSVPRVHHRNLAQGFLLLDDLGDHTFLALVSENGDEQAYHLAIETLLQIQQADAAALPAYDEALLQREMSLFHDWYLGRHRRRQLSPAESAQWRSCCEALAAAALAQPRVFVHRDYHSRNLMWTPQGRIGVLDFQDAVHGPISYDLVSLLRDCYVAWPPQQVQGWLHGYHQAALDAGLPVPALDAFARDFDWMGVQRHLKAAGIFSRLNYRDGKDGYLADIPRTLAYIRDVSAAYPDLAFLHELVDECLS